MSDTIWVIGIIGGILGFVAIWKNLIHLRREQAGVIEAMLDTEATISIPNVCRNYHLNKINTVTNVLHVLEEPELEIPGIIFGVNTFAVDSTEAAFGKGHFVHLKDPATGKWDFRYAHQLGVNGKELEAMNAAIAAGNKASLKREILADNQFTQALAPSKETKTIFRSSKHSESPE